jgi:hypothetical protein
VVYARGDAVVTAAGWLAVGGDPEDAGPAFGATDAVSSVTMATLASTVAVQASKKLIAERPGL